jgi:hypothetical protein
VKQEKNLAIFIAVRVLQAVGASGGLLALAKAFGA